MNKTTRARQVTVDVSGGGQGAESGEEEGRGVRGGQEGERGGLASMKEGWEHGRRTVGEGNVPEGRGLRLLERWCCLPRVAVMVAVASDSLSPSALVDEGPAEPST